MTDKIQDLTDSFISQMKDVFREEIVPRDLNHKLVRYFKMIEKKSKQISQVYKEVRENETDELSADPNEIAMNY